MCARKKRLSPVLLGTLVFCSWGLTCLLPLAHGQRECTGISITDLKVSEPLETGITYLVHVSVSLYNSYAVDARDVQVRVDFTGSDPSKSYEPVLLNAELVKAKSSARIEGYGLLRARPYRYSISVVGCQIEEIDIEGQLRSLHAADRSIQAQVVEILAGTTTESVPELLRLLDQRTAQNVEEAERELLEDLLLIETLLRLGDHRALPSIANALTTYQSLVYGSAYEHLIHRPSVPPIELLDTARVGKTSLRETILTAVASAGSDLVPELARLALGTDSSAPNRDSVFSMLRAAALASPDSLLRQSDSTQRHSIVQALIRVPDPDIAELLLRATIAHPEDRDLVIAAFEQTGAPAVYALVDTLHSPDIKVRDAAFEALLSINQTIAAPAITQAAQELNISRPEGMPIEQLLDVLLGHIEQEHATTQAEWIEQAIKHLNAGNCQAAREAVDSAYEVDYDLAPHCATVSQAYVCVAETQIEEGQPQKATMLLELGVAKQCDTPEIRHVLQEAYLSQAERATAMGHLTVADLILERALDLGPDRGVVDRLIEVKLGLANTSMEDGDWPGAERYLRQALTWAPDSPIVVRATRRTIVRHNAAYLAIGALFSLAAVVWIATFQPEDPITTQE